MSVPFISHSEITDTIYIVCGTSKYNATEQVIKAMRETGRLEPERPHGEWKPYIDSAYCGGGYLLCTKCNWRFSFGAYRILQDDNYCPRCGAYMRRKEGEDENKTRVQDLGHS